ncbi:MAG: methyltransferase domain-containing protein [Methanomicrobiaceae archaeon]|nr:methyltransferase domain-containing protein [Methanomicrobiaceae archaeon]
MKLIFELSGEHPKIPFCEIECVGKLVDCEEQVAVAQCPQPEDTERLAMTHSVMEYLGECNADRSSFEDLLKDLNIKTGNTFAGRVKKVSGTSVKDSRLDLERCIGSHIEGPVSLDSPEEEYRAVFSGERCFFGRVLFKIDRGGFAYRNPMRRAFFHPGVMMPVMARTLVNLALADMDDLLLDPFCGTGGILLEGKMLGCRVIGSDMDRSMLKGCRENLSGAEVMCADATHLPLPDASVDVVTTDLPYGQSVCIRAVSMNNLYNDSLAEIRRVLKPGGRAVVVTHVDVRKTASNHFNIKQFHEQRVHKSLTRRIMVLD